MNKVIFIQEFINHRDVISEEQNLMKAKEVSELIVETFQNEIEKIHDGLDNYIGFGLHDSKTLDYLSGINKLKMKLLNYIYDIYDLKRNDEITENELEKLRL